MAIAHFGYDHKNAWSMTLSDFWPAYLAKFGKPEETRLEKLTKLRTLERMRKKFGGFEIG